MEMLGVEPSQRGVKVNKWSEKRGGSKIVNDRDVKK